MPAIFPAAMPVDADLGVAKNFFGTTLAVGVDGTAAAWTLAASGAVVGEYLVVDSEIVRVLTAAGASITVARAQDGTAAAPHATAAAVVDNACALHHNQSRMEILAGLAELARTNNTTMAGLCEIVSIVGKMQAGVDAAVIPVAAAANPLIAGMTEALTLLGMITEALWLARTSADGGLILPGSLRVNGRTMLAIPTTAPTDSDIPNSFTGIWLNESTDKLTFRVRRSNGALLTKEI